MYIRGEAQRVLFDERTGFVWSFDSHQKSRTRTSYDVNQVASRRAAITELRKLLYSAPVFAVRLASRNVWPRYLQEPALRAPFRII
jgi:hypothetical protein